VEGVCVSGQHAVAVKRKTWRGFALWPTSLFASLAYLVDVDVDVDVDDEVLHRYEGWSNGIGGAMSGKPRKWCDGNNDVMDNQTPKN